MDPASSKSSSFDQDFKSFKTIEHILENHELVSFSQPDSPATVTLAETPSPPAAAYNIALLLSHDTPVPRVGTP